MRACASPTRPYVAGWLVAFASLALLIPPVSAQRLPAGKHHTERERSYDIVHYRARLTLDFEAHAVTGRATVRLAPLRPVTRVGLDAEGLTVSEVTFEGANLEYAADGDTLTVFLPTEAPAGEELAFEVAYSATPESGLYFQPDPRHPERTFVHTYGEGGLHANWLPIYATLNDKFTSEMIVTVPEGLVAVSNGRLVETRDNPDGTVTWHWLQERPHPPYLISVYAGDFVRGELEPAFGEIPLAYWVPRGRLEEGAYAFRNTTRMVEFYSERFAYPYPWVKYDQVAVPDYAIGAMEHTGVTGHRASVLRQAGEAPLDFGGPTFSEYWTDWSAEATISHELAHHWFGNNLTCSHLGHIWLNESFASYLMMLWDERSVGYDQLLFDVELARRHYFDHVSTEHRIRPLDYPYFDAPDEIYNVEHTYLKGAAFLHMMRSVLGDAAFFDSLGHYLRKHEYAHVESQDLLAAIREATGRNLEWLFEDWVHGGGHPVLEAEWRWLEDRGQVDLVIRQVQPIVEGQGLFRLPATVTVDTPAGARHHRIVIAEEEGKWLLPAPAEPRMVSLDGEGSLIAEIHFDKEPDELAYQGLHDALPGRLRALGGLVRSFPTHPETLATLETVLAGDGFWALRAEAAELLGLVRTPAAEALAGRALEATDYRVRKAAVLGLGQLATPTAIERLGRVVAEDHSADVVGTALVALARSAPALDLEILRNALGRSAWYDELTIAALRGLKEIGTPEVVELARQYVGPAYNQDVRMAALAAWEAAEPTDGALHQVLLEAAAAPPYAVRKYALEALGRLYVEEALPQLDGIVTRDFDPNLTDLAREAAEEIRRVRGETP